MNGRSDTQGDRADLSLHPRRLLPGPAFRNLDDLNDQLGDWLENVVEAFAMERAQLKPLPAGPYKAVLRLKRRITRDGMVSVGGNLYSMPDGTRRQARSSGSMTDESEELYFGRSGEI